jgi:hypothetical protein
MERWGVFSVIDHKDEIRLATELMLYDKIAVPTPIEGDSKDWKRWEKNGWAPERLMKIIGRPNLRDLFIETEWDLNRKKNWKNKFEEAKAAIHKVNSEIQQAIDNRVAAAAADNAHRSKRELDKAIEAASYAETKNEIIRHLKGTVEFYHGPVEFYAAYQSRAEFDALHHTEDSIQQGVERVNFLIQHRLAVPDLEPDILLDRVAELTSSVKFKERRRLFYDWQINQLQHSDCGNPEAVIKELNQIVQDFNAQAVANDQKCRWETVVTVMAVAGAAVAAWAGLDPTSLKAATGLSPGAAALAGGLNAMGIAALRKKKLGRAEADAQQRIAAGGAMFHQIGTDVDVVFRTVAIRQARDLPRRF